jgi:hypothetical protein
MADYCGTTRSSYFYVTDEDKYEEFKKHVVAEDLEFWDEKDKNGKTAHAFGGYCEIDGYVDNIDDDYEDEDYPDYDLFLKKLSELIAPGSACVIMQAGNENLRYVVGDVSVVMHGGIKNDSLESASRRIMENAGINPDDIKLYY